jgi:hypothetical protein
MALSEFEIKRCEKALQAFLEETRPPAHIRAELDLSYRINGQSVEIFEIRPSFRDPEQSMETPVAKATYVKSKSHWKVYWMRQDLKWHPYPPAPRVSRFGEFLNLVKADSNACFFG